MVTKQGRVEYRIWLDKELHEAVTNKAEAEGRPLSHVIRALLGQWLEKPPQKPSL